MSEQASHYSNTPALTVEAFRNRPCSRLPDEEGYIPPTHSDVKALRSLTELSQTKCARLTGVSYNHKGSTTVRKWETDESKEDHRSVHPSSFLLMLYAAGVRDFDTDLMRLRNS
jgi:DNA-binding transcriptional regulator YiaG